MKVAVASSDFRNVTGHAGRARKFLVFEVTAEGTTTTEPVGIELEPDMVFHHFKDDRPHPLDGIDALITLSAGESFVKKMAGRGVDAIQTAETDAAKAVRDYAAAKLAPPKPRPIGGLLCKTIDLFSKKG
jgi:predicted Fe-Mo cluster-binding NifX family protein